MKIGTCDCCEAKNVELSRAELAGLETWSCADGCPSKRQQVAYNVFRGGFGDGHPNRPPHWDDLEPWIRDALTVAYLQGQLDGLPKKNAASEQYGPHRCWFPHKDGGEAAVTLEHEIAAIDRACGYGA